MSHSLELLVFAMNSTTLIGVIALLAPVGPAADAAVNIVSVVPLRDLEIRVIITVIILAHLNVHVGDLQVAGLLSLFEKVRMVALHKSFEKLVIVGVLVDVLEGSWGSELYLGPLGSGFLCAF